MTDKCIRTLRKMRNPEFNILSLEQLIYECLKGNQWDAEELKFIIDLVVQDRELIAGLENEVELEEILKDLNIDYEQDN